MITHEESNIYANFLADVTELVNAVKADISPEYRASCDQDDDVPGIQITLAVDTEREVQECNYVYQTGDNSFTGACYTKQHWGVTGVYEDSDSADLAQDLLDQLLEQTAEY